MNKAMVEMDQVIQLPDAITDIYEHCTARINFPELIIFFTLLGVIISTYI